jgi:hypothetical protein
MKEMAQRLSHELKKKKQEKQKNARHTVQVDRFVHITVNKIDFFLFYFILFF